MSLYRHGRKQKAEGRDPVPKARLTCETAAVHRHGGAVGKNPDIYVPVAPDAQSVGAVKDNAYVLTAFAEIPLGNRLYGDIFQNFKGFICRSDLAVNINRVEPEKSRLARHKISEGLIFIESYGDKLLGSGRKMGENQDKSQNYPCQILFHAVTPFI